MAEVMKAVDRIYRAHPAEPPLTVGVNEAARRIGIHRKTLWLWWRNGIGPRRFRPNGGRTLIAISDLESWIREQADAGQKPEHANDREGVQS